MKCKDCKHWIRDKMSDEFLPEDEFGSCEGLFDVIDIINWNIIVVTVG